MVMRMDVVKEDRRCSAAMVIFPPLQFLSVELQTLAPERRPLPMLTTCAAAVENFYSSNNQTVH
jgi:hypothetical protein